jgi:hypothetical protein
MKKISQFPGLETAPTGGPSSVTDPSAQPQETFKIIYSPLDSVGKILADLDFKSFLQNHFGDNPKDLATKIWTMYGGDPKEKHRGKEGAREDKPQFDDITQQSDAQQQEYNDTRNSRWLRLPVGMSIDDITNTGALEKIITGGFEVLASQNKKPATSSILQKLIKTANSADEKENHKFADKIDFLISNVYTS